MKKIYNKLVRDKIPEIIQASGKKPVTRFLKETKYLEELIKKLKEETSEFKAEPSLEELADIQEVVLALTEALGSSKEELEKVRAEKASSRGAFKDKIFLEYVE